MFRPFLSVIIPAFNESEILPITLIDVDRYLREQEYQYEILVIDDGSHDDTPKIVDKFSPLIKKLTLIKNTGNRGKGSAIRIGMLAAKGELRLVMDPKNSVPLTEFNKMMPFFKEEKCDIVVGSRRRKGVRMNLGLPVAHRISESAINLTTRLIFKSQIKDFLLGFHCFTAEAAEKIFSSTKMNKWSFFQEALILGENMRFKIQEIAINPVHLLEGKFIVRIYLQTLYETFKIRWWLKRGRYNIINN